MDNEWFVKVVEIETGDIVKRMGPMSEWEAGRVAKGVRINLNTDDYTINVTDER